MSPSFLNKWDTCLHSNKMVSAGNLDHDHSNISFVNFFIFKEVANFSVEAGMHLWFLSSGAEI